MTEIIVTEPINHIIHEALRQVSPGAARVYAQTFKLWRSWCDENSINALLMYPANVLRFLAAQNVAKSTRQRQLSALRQLAKMMDILHPSGGAGARRAAQK
jgi:hypothetical protein